MRRCLKRASAGEVPDGLGICGINETNGRRRGQRLSRLSGRAEVLVLKNKDVVLCVLLVLPGCTGHPEGVQPVSGFELARYLGIWHEIARLDHAFERGLTDVTAHYSRRDDGGIDVINRGYDPDKGGWTEARGRAYLIGDADVASLKVSFFGPFYGGYHVFALDPEYRWAIVAGPSREYLWILARQPELPPEVLTELLARARRAGFATDALIYPGTGLDGSGSTDVITGTVASGPTPSEGRSASLDIL